ncbi:MAG TPA: DUF4105 domain-containing protein [Chitinophagaceae bacterium]|nr:DUF4105 domain-containing protein [Chitinophagaceae bacterium]
MNSFFAAYRKCFFTLLFGVCLITGYHQVAAQSCHLRISLLTCGSGEDLYATFGHSAVRVIDSVNGGDYVFNYGTFDVDTPHFYWKFMRGRLMYSLSVSDFPDFMVEYHAEKRTVTEQVLNLSCQDKEMIWQFLRVNYMPQNRYYKYDFLFDNCSTRIRNIFTRIFGPGWKVADIVPRKDLSFRELINSYLGQKPWERLGINLMFGKSTDRAMTRQEIMFLPRYLETGLDSSLINGKPLVKSSRLIYDPGPQPEEHDPFYLHPLFWLTLLSALIIILSFNTQWRAAGALMPWIDRFLFFLTGLLGIFLLFMWFGTDHRVCRWNYNLLWAFPFNLIFSFFVQRDTRGVKRYATLVIVLNLFLLLGWFVMPQQLPLAVIPLVAALVVRAWHILSRPRLKLL